MSVTSPVYQSFSRVFQAIGTDALSLENRLGENDETKEVPVYEGKDQRPKVPNEQALADFTIFTAILSGYLDRTLPTFFDHPSGLIDLVAKDNAPIPVRDDLKYARALFYERAFTALIGLLKTELADDELTPLTKSVLQSTLESLQEVTRQAVQKQKTRIYYLMQFPEESCPQTIVPNCDLELEIVQSYWWTLFSLFFENDFLDQNADDDGEE